jgi:hypothetical protein
VLIYIHMSLSFNLRMALVVHILGIVFLMGFKKYLLDLLF